MPTSCKIFLSKAPGTTAFDHTTGEGYVAAKKGQYSQAGINGDKTIPISVEPSGAFGGEAVAELIRASKRSKQPEFKGAQTYQWSAPSHRIHFGQQLSGACVMTDAADIRKGINLEKVSALRMNGNVGSY